MKCVKRSPQKARFDAETSKSARGFRLVAAEGSFRDLAVSVLPLRQDAYSCVLCVPVGLRTPESSLPTFVIDQEFAHDLCTFMVKVKCYPAE